MSTYYRPLREPWSSIRDEPFGIHIKVSLWINGALTGHIIVGSDELPEALESFFDTDPACQHYASADGPKLRKFHDPRTDTLLSDYSDIVSYRDLVEEFGEPGKAP